MLYDALKRTIERGGYDVADIREKLGIFLSANRISQNEYVELCSMLPSE